MASEILILIRKLLYFFFFFSSGLIFKRNGVTYAAVERYSFSGIVEFNP